MAVAIQLWKLFEIMKIYKLKLKKIFLPRRKREVVKIFSNTNKIDRVLKLQLNKNGFLQIHISS